MVDLVDEGDLLGFLEYFDRICREQDAWEAVRFAGLDGVKIGFASLPAQSVSNEDGEWQLYPVMAAAQEVEVAHMAVARRMAVVARMAAGIAAEPFGRAGVSRIERVGGCQFGSW